MDDFPTRAGVAAHQRKSSTLKPILGVAGAAFLLGAAAVGAAGWYGLFDGFGDSPETVEESIAAADESVVAASSSPGATAVSEREVAEAAEAVERVTEQQGGLDHRIVAMEQRLSALDLQVQAAAGNTARAEGLLIAFATRRAIERGAPLGYLEDQLRLRFGDARPNTVETVIDAAADPVTLDQLIARLEGLAPALIDGPQDEGAWEWLTRELNSLFVIRSESAPSPQPARRLARARMFLETGRSDSAAAEVRNLPNAAGAEEWIADAERYSRVQRALDRLETTAILEPRELRDGSGNRVEQPSPAQPR